MAGKNYDEFKNLTFNDFKRLAQDDSLSKYEKIGFPISYRKGKEDRIFSDLTKKLRNLNKEEQRIVDIGCGCSDFAFLTIDLCHKKNHHLVLIDSQEMLDHLPEKPFITKVPCYYPN